MSAKNSGRVAIHQRKHKYCWRYLDSGDKTCYLSVFTIVAISSFVSHGYIFPSTQIYFYHTWIRYGELKNHQYHKMKNIKWFKRQLTISKYLHLFSYNMIYPLQEKFYSKFMDSSTYVKTQLFLYTHERENQIKYCHFCRLYKRLFPIAIDLHRKYISIWSHGALIIPFGI